MTNPKGRPNRTQRPKSWKGDIKESAARKAAQGPDPKKTSIPELVEPASETDPASERRIDLEKEFFGTKEETAPKPHTSETDPNLIGLDEVSEFTAEQHSADTEVLSDKTGPMPEADIPPTEDAPVPADIPPTEPDVHKQEDIPKTEPDPTKVLEAVVEDGVKLSRRERIGKVLSKIPGLGVGGLDAGRLIGTRWFVKPYRAKMTEYALSAQAAETETPAEPAPAEEPVLVTRSKKIRPVLRKIAEDLRKIAEDSSAQAAETETPAEPAPAEEPVLVADDKPSKIKGVLSKIPLLGRIVTYKSRDQKTEDALRKQAAEAEPAPSEEQLYDCVTFDGKSFLGRDGKPIKTLGDLFQKPQETPKKEAAVPEPESPAPETNLDSERRMITLGDLIGTNAETEHLDDVEEPGDTYVPTPTESLTDDEDTDASATGETERPPEEPVTAGVPKDAVEPAYVPTETEPLEDPEVGIKTEPLDVEEAMPKVTIKPKKKGLRERIFGKKEKPAKSAKEPAKAPSLEDAVKEKATMYTAGVTFNEKYAPILMLAAGERAVINKDNRALWEKTLENIDYEAEADPEKAELRDCLFAVYARADGCKSKDKEILVYVLSELASASSDKGEHEKAFQYADAACKVGKAELMEKPTAETLHKWGMLEHNIKIYEKEMKENTVAAEA